MYSFAKRLKELRMSRNLSQQSLADIVEISKSSINMYERGEREPGLDTVGKLADFFDVQTDYLLGKSSDTRSPKQAKKYNKLILKTLEEYRMTHHYDRKQMEDLLDWSNMYFELEQNITRGDEGLLKTITGLLSLPLSLKAQTPPTEPKLTEGEEMLLQLFRQIPEEQQRVFLEMGRVFANNLRKD